MTVPASIGEPAALVLILEDGNTLMYPQVEVYASGSSTPLATVDLAHRAKGHYEGIWTPATVGSYTALFITYADAGHSVESMLYTREGEQLFVTRSHIDDIAAKLLRVLGLVHENAFIDNTTYDSNCMLLTARLRIFATKEEAQAATDGGSEPALEVYTVDATYEGPGRMKQYRMVKEA
jgi:hypothetical protein